MKIYASNTFINFSHVKDVLERPLLPDCALIGLLYFLDLEPEANWAHPCIYLFSAQRHDIDYYLEHTWPPNQKLWKNMSEVRQAVILEGTGSPENMPIEYNITKRWEQGVPHHPKSIALFKRLAEIDFQHCADYFCWKSGGDGDNGETLMYELDILFEERDSQEEKSK
jgi:hypothetical protein